MSLSSTEKPAASQSPTKAPAASPRFIHAVMCLLGIMLTLITGLFVFTIELHSLMFLCLVFIGVNAYLLGHDYSQIRSWMSEAISRALPAIYIFLLIGMVIASFMHSGTIATLLYYGLELLSPGSFLAVGLLLCSVMSLVTGTSWGTVGTVGVVLMGIGDTLGIPLPLVAGMIISGATFGDKLSPISDTSNLAAMSAGTSLYRHIYSMSLTTAPAFLLVLLVFIVMGQTYQGSSINEKDLQSMQMALLDNYHLNPFISLLPLLTMVALSMRRVSAELCMTVSVLVAVIIAIAYQQHAPVQVLNALWQNSATNTGLASLDDLLGRGGIYSMAWTLILALMALALGGILQGAGFLTVLLETAIKGLQRKVSLIASTIAAGIIGNMAMGEAYISIILNCQLFKSAYQRRHLDTAVLSRSVEEGSTMTTGLIPWTTAGAFYAATLGVAVVDYAPYALFNYFNPLISIAMAACSVGLLTKSKSD
ncbi:MAG: Na+/H+ antiporter NhaC [SAR86 cluster bacterium]|uniref:Na+/H+ antiporter NhaC n=1 Tax=SAR86 cluster bacterium TaxID=2030880 RepID=A0A2A4MH84_9GAMM|nr:MAG: Na+/H+ antiporter NhaC [SAR86 cluster bacterium]